MVYCTWKNHVYGLYYRPMFLSKTQRFGNWTFFLAENGNRSSFRKVVLKNTGRWTKYIKVILSSEYIYK
jgi:hypothetical protein